ncbi:response regulator [archaeon]|nr:response regulator [archaeon]
MSLNVLIAEDEVNCLLLFVKTITSLGGKVTGCSTCQEAMLELVKNPNYDLILTDLVQEPYSGVDLSRIARVLCKNPFIVVCTGNPNTELASRAKLSADLVIGKVDYMSYHKKFYSLAEERVKQVKTD